MPDTGTPTSSPSGKIVTIFGSSKPKEGSHEYEEARLIGERLASRGISVCTGGYGGIMEAASRGASGYDVKIIGVTSAVFSPTPNEFVNVQVHTRSLFERLQKLVELGDGFVILKGGTGTLVELATVWELMNKKLVSQKPIVAATEFWRPVIDLLDEEMVAEGLPSFQKIVKIAAKAEDAIEIILKSIAGS